MLRSPLVPFSLFWFQVPLESNEPEGFDEGL